MSKAVRLKWSSVVAGAAALLVFGMWLWPQLEEEHVPETHEQRGSRLSAAVAAKANSANAPNNNHKQWDSGAAAAAMNANADAAAKAAAADNAAAAPNAGGAANDLQLAQAAHAAAAASEANAGGGVGGKYWTEWADGRPRIIDPSVFEKPPGTLASVICMTALPERLGTLTELSVGDLWLQPDLIVLTVPVTHEVDGKKGALPAWIAKYEEKLVVMRTKVSCIACCSLQAESCFHVPSFFAVALLLLNICAADSASNRHHIVTPSSVAQLLAPPIARLFTFLPYRSIV
jgi:hypothetical protein